MTVSADVGVDGDRSDKHFVRMRRSKLGELCKCYPMCCSVVNYSVSVTTEMPMDESVSEGSGGCSQ